MVTTRNMGDRILWKPDLTNGNSVVNEDGSIAGAPTFNNGVTVDGVNDYVTYSTNGILSKIKTLTTGTIAITTNIDNDTGIDPEVCFAIGRTVDITVTSLFISYAMDTNILRAGLSLNNTTKWSWESQAGFATQFIGTDVRISIVQNGTQSKFYFNGVENTLGSFVVSTDKTLWIESLYSETNSADAIRLGANTRSDLLVHFPGTIKSPVIIGEQWTADEALDDYENDTYSEVDASKALMWLPAKSAFNDGFNNVTENIGTANNVLFGDGYGANEPTLDGTGTIIFSSSPEYLKSTEAAYKFNGDSTFTCGCMYKGTSSSGQTIMSCDSAALTFKGWELTHVSTNQLRFLLSNNFLGGDAISVSTNGASPQPNDNLWHSLFLTYDGSGVAAGVELYIDGIQQSKTISTDNLTTPGFTNIADFAIGERLSTSSDLIGDLRQPMVFTSVLTPRQIRWLHEKMLKEINT